LAKKRKVLKRTDVEKLDGQFPGLALEVKAAPIRERSAALIAIGELASEERPL
jgi:hypothetical protein